MSHPSNNEDVVLRLPSMVVYADLRNNRATIIPKGGPVPPPLEALTLSLEQLETAIAEGVSAARLAIRRQERLAQEGQHHA